VGVSIFYENSSTVSKTNVVEKFTTGSYACLYLVHAFSTLIDSTRTISEIIGLRMRISELYEQFLEHRGGLYGSCTSNHQIDENGIFNSGDSVWLRRISLLLCGGRRECVETTPLYSLISSSTKRMEDDDRYISLVDMHSTVGSHGTSNCDKADRANSHRHAFPAFPGVAAKVNNANMKTTGDARSVVDISGVRLLLSMHALNIYASALPSSRRVLIRSLSLDIHRGMKVLVTGPSGCGKSSILKTLMECARFQTELAAATADLSSECGSNTISMIQQSHSNNSISFTFSPCDISLCQQNPFMTQVPYFYNMQL
jgi:ABC-type multidrug transport system fused ATPase/permease subunit